MLTRLQLDPERAAFLVSFFETYRQLNPQEEEELAPPLLHLGPLPYSEDYIPPRCRIDASKPALSQPHPRFNFSGDLPVLRI